MSSTEENIQKAADAIFDAHATKKPVAPIRDMLEDGDVDGAYAVQEINTKRWLDAGRTIVGRKIGLTSVSVQKQLGVDQPDYGMLFADMSVPEGEEVPVGTLIQPKVEAEVAFVVGRDLAEPDLTMSDLMSAIEYVLPAVEIVDSRISNWDIRILDTVADNASSGLYVLGTTPRKLDGLNLRSCGMVMTLKGEPMATGAGAACLGHPLNAALWLAKTMARVGRPLGAGDQIMSGALGPMVVAKPGNVFEARIEGLGSVRAQFAKGE
ncbi:2-keto-4-pentenoate hydratase [Rhodobium orientis]|nr:fumarylacetoacetate hydrolase family protein [Rhodobium orientis]MBB4301281.1 2-keto-4-pentenoate hydratase [Rhodobium orientis]